MNLTWGYKEQDNNSMQLDHVEYVQKSLTETHPIEIWSLELRQTYRLSGARKSSSTASRQACYWIEKEPQYFEVRAELFAKTFDH